MYSQPSLPSVRGSSMPAASAATVHARPSTISRQPVRANFFCTRPNSIANTMKNSEMLPAAPLVWAAAASWLTPSTVS